MVKDIYNYILTLEESKNIQKYGYDFNNSPIIWKKVNGIGKSYWAIEIFNLYHKYEEEIVFAPMLEQILEVLPLEIGYEGVKYKRTIIGSFICYKSEDGKVYKDMMYTSPNLLDSAYSMAIFLKSEH